ncbi:MAG: hypothetical protein ACKO0V_10965, partial [bacterium]
MFEITQLPTEILDLLLDRQGAEPLPFQSLDETTAAELARSERPLNLSNLKTLTDSAAAAFSHHSA